MHNNLLQLMENRLFFVLRLRSFLGSEQICFRSNNLNSLKLGVQTRTEPFSTSMEKTQSNYRDTKACVCVLEPLSVHPYISVCVCMYNLA